jgi:DNA polymerase III epsilon subunit family exonuclease
MAVVGLDVLNDLLYSGDSLIQRRAYQAVRDRGGLAEPKLVVKRALRLSGKAPDFSPVICEAILARNPVFRLANGNWYIKPLLECHRPFGECEFTVLDFEATGGKPPDDKITEVAMIRLKKGKVVDEYSALVNPERQIPPYVVKLIGITDRMVEEMLRIEDILPDILDFMRGSFMVVHNASGDLPFLDYECLNLYGGVVGLPVFDTQHLAQHFIPDIGGLGLERISDYFGIELTDRHRAVGDAVTTSRILGKFIESVGDRLPRDIFL